MKIDKAELERLRELVFDANYTLESARERPDLSKPIIGSMVAPSTISPKVKELVIYSSKYARHVCISPINSWSQNYSYWIDHKGLYIPFTACVEGGMGDPEDGVYFHLYSKFGHDVIDRKWADGVGRYDGNYDKHDEQRMLRQPEIFYSLVNGSFKG